MENLLTSQETEDSDDRVPANNRGTVVSGTVEETSFDNNDSIVESSDDQEIASMLKRSKIWQDEKNR